MGIFPSSVLKHSCARVIQPAAVIARESEKGEINVRVRESLRGFYMPVWEHGAPGLALPS